MPTRAVATAATVVAVPPPPLLTPFVAVVPPLAAAAVVRPRHAADAVPIPAADVARYDYPTVSGW